MFERFLLGDSLEECYDAVAEVANRWLDMLDTQASTITGLLSNDSNPDDCFCAMHRAHLYPLLKHADHLKLQM